MKKYGLPYQDSKSRIAEWVIETLPPGKVLVDLFAGGCAVTHCALLSKKWEGGVIANDLQSAPALFVDAVAGKFANETRWISREDFFRLKDSEPYIRWCWSFGDGGDAYLYSKEIEPWKRALHFARVFGDCSELAKFGIASDGSLADIIEHHAEYKEQYIKWYLKNVLLSDAEFEVLAADLKAKIRRGEEELRGYLIGALKASCLTQAEVQRRLGTQMAGHYFGRSQWEFPTREMYDRMREFMPLPLPFDEVYGLQQLRKNVQSLQSLQSLQRLQSLERLQSLQSFQRLQRLQSLQSLSNLQRLQRLQSLQSLSNLQRLQRLQSLQSLQRLTILQRDYRVVEIPDGATVYCDIPYQTAEKCFYGVDFDRRAFCDWALSRPFPVFVSEYAMPEGFVCIAQTRHICTMNNAKVNHVTERIFVQKKYENQFKTELF